MSEVFCAKIQFLNNVMKHLNRRLKTLSSTKWCIIIASLLGVFVYSIHYVFKAVNESCRTGVWSQQQEDERLIRLFGQQE